MLGAQQKIKLFPTIELLDDGEAGRFRRFRSWFYGVVATVLLAVIASFVYDRLNGA